MSGFSNFKLGQRPAVINKGASRWKPEVGKYRASFVAVTGWDNKDPQFGDDSEIDINHATRIYHQKVGFFIDHGPQYQEFNNGKPGKVHITTTMCFWPVSRTTGQLDKARLSSGDYEVLTWIFSVDKYEQLVGINSEYPLARHDVKIDVTDAKFHKMSFTPCRDSVFATLKESSPEMFAKIVNDVHVIHSDSSRSLAQNLTIDQIRERISGEIGSPVSGTTSGSLSSFDDAEDILNGVLDDD
jgi:hypothetical protein